MKKLKDKFGMVFGVLNLMIISYLCGKYLIKGQEKELLCKYISYCLIFIISIRAIRYFFKGWQFFMVDFCYLVNIITLTFYFCFP
jgi:hypothetical protein